MDTKRILEVATSLAEKSNTDILFYNGPINRPYDESLIDLCRKTGRRENVLLFLCTQGGDADAAFRIARCLQQKYAKFTVAICGFCKSAGTLLAVGAHELVISDLGELGPLDVQLGKKDELWETDSGLTVLSAIKTLEEKTFNLFETSFLSLKSRSGGRITLRTATELASKLAIGVVSPIVAQIDPMHIGEVGRAMNVGLEYGKRLAAVSRNPNTNALNTLAESYPSHGFVIDRTEAKTLFAKITEPTPEQEELIELLGFSVRRPETEPLITYLSKPKAEANHEDNHEAHPGDEPAPAVGGNGEPAGVVPPDQQAG